MRGPPAAPRLGFHLVQFAVTGTSAHWVDFERVQLQPGDLLHVQPEQVHSSDPGANHEALILFFTPGALEAAHIPQPARWQASTVLRPTQSDFRILTELLRVQEELDTESTELRPGSIGPNMLGDDPRRIVLVDPVHGPGEEAWVAIRGALFTKKKVGGEPHRPGYEEPPLPLVLFLVLTHSLFASHHMVWQPIQIRLEESDALAGLCRQEEGRLTWGDSSAGHAPPCESG